MPPIKIFQHEPNDDAYLAWLDQYPHGYVLNVDHARSVEKYPMAHTTKCAHIRNRKNLSTNEYFKVCAASLAALKQWIKADEKYKSKNKEDLTLCGHCLKKHNSENMTGGKPSSEEDIAEATSVALSENAATVIPTLEEDIAEIERRGDIGQTEKETLIKARRGQGKFREEVLSLYPCCPISGVAMQTLLIASHIKPWWACNDNERLDKYNSLMLAPNIDALFDSGLITFADNGSIRISGHVSAQEQKRLGITPLMRLEPVYPGAKQYLAWHNKHIFQP